MPMKVTEVILKGKPISRGIAIGKLFLLNRSEQKVAELNISPVDSKREIRRFRNALARSKQDIKRLQKQLELESIKDGILILDAQLEMLHDPLLVDEIESEIVKTNKNAEFVFQEIIKKYQKKFEAINDTFFVERFEDLKDLSRRIFNYLVEGDDLSLDDLPPHSIVCAQELTASDAAEATSISVSAFITESGGTTSHTAIVAKAKGIPYITNIDFKFLRDKSGNFAIVDGRKGMIILNPQPETIQKYEDLQQMIQFQAKSLEKLTQLPAETFDGYSICLSANLDMIHEIDLIHELGGKGIGLFRSEYIFLPKNDIPSEDEQFRIYESIVEKMKGLPIVIRTFDLGGDKISQSYSFSKEKNPFLGSRATRFLLKEQKLFKSQIRAILRANTLGNVSILFPMISTLLELREAKRMVYEAKEELGLTTDIRIGCMIEVPSAAIITDYMARECDFLSIGTNDLIQYSLAIDRGNQVLGEFYEQTDPSIIRLIKLITHEANQAGIPVAVCGEVASDPRFTPLLLGLGVQELSVTPRSLPFIKNAIRNTSIVEAVQLAEDALRMSTAQDVLQLLSHEYKKNVPHDLYYNMAS